MRYSRSLTLLLSLLTTSHSYAETKKPTPPPVSIMKQVGVVKIQFDFTRAVIPNRIVNANNPPTWRAYLPSCPPGSQYVSGVSPNLLELDQPPNYLYCKCICLGQCYGLPGVTSYGGKIPIYKATVTCSATVQGWFDSAWFSKGPANLTPIPHQYYYCQSGNCTTHPLPASVGYSVPTGGYNNTTYIDFEACTVAYATGVCSAPDQSAVGKRTIF